MTRQVERRCRWVMWWSVVVFFATLTLAKAITSSHDEVMANKTAVIGLNDFNSEERMINFATELDSLTTFKQHVQAELKNVPTWTGRMMAKLIMRNLMSPESDETKVREMLNDLKKVLPNGPDLALAQLKHWEQSGVSDKDIVTKMLKSDEKGSNLLTDLSLLNTWINYGRDKFFFGVKMDEALYNLLKEQDDLKQLAQFVVTPQKHWLLHRVQIIFEREWLEDLKRSGMEPEDFYARLKLNEVPGPLENPLVSLWIKYTPMVDYYDWYFGEAMKFYGEKDLVHALVKLKTIPEEVSIILMGERLYHKWREEGKNAEDIKELLRQDRRLTEKDRASIMKDWRP